MSSLVLKRISIRILKIPLKQKYNLSFKILEFASPVVLSIEASNGIKGYGEADPLIPFTNVSSENIYDELILASKKLIGREISTLSNIQEIEEELSKNFHGMTVGAIDMALLDVFCRNKKTTVYQLFCSSAFHEKIKVLYPLSNQGVEEDQKCIEEKMKEGYRCFMLKAGKNEIEKHINRIEKLDQIFGDKITLCVDPNQSWNLEETNRFIKHVKKLKIMDFLEQPLPRSDTEGYTKLDPDMKISLDESIHTLSDFESVTKTYVPDIVSVKVSKNGGILNTIHLIKKIGEKKIQCLFNSMIETGITQAASLNIAFCTPKLYDFGHAFMSTHRLAYDITNFCDLFGEGDLGMVNCPSQFGLGIEIDESKLENSTLKRKDIE